jgi:hypothetical protein
VGSPAGYSCQAAFPSAVFGESASTSSNRAVQPEDVADREGLAEGGDGRAERRVDDQ